MSLATSPLVKALLAATGTAIGFIVGQAGNLGKYGEIVTIVGTIAGYYIAQLIAAESASSPEAKEKAKQEAP